MLTRALSPAVPATRSPRLAVTPGPVAWDADEALEQLYAAHWRALVRLAVLLVRDQGVAEDVVQDAFVAVHARWRRLRDPDRALAYLRQAVVNGARSSLRHRAVVARHAEREAGRSGGPDRPDGTAPGSDEQVLADERRQRVLDAMAGLPRRQREVLALRHYAGMSEAEIADALGISRGSVKSHASRGAVALRAALAEEER